MDDPNRRHDSGAAPVSVHFVNNVLAAAASYIEDDPEVARDVLAELGAFLTHRLRGPRKAALREELEHVAVYLRLEQARFPGRIDAELPAATTLPSVEVEPGAIQAPMSEALSGWLTRHAGRVRIALRARDAAVDLQLDLPDEPGQAGERLRVELGVPQGWAA